MNDWFITVSGTVTHIDRQNVDKTLRNPKFFYYLRVRPEGPPEVELAPPSAVITEQPVFGVKETDLRTLVETIPVVGDRVWVRGEGSGRAPEQFTLRELRIIRTK